MRIEGFILCRQERMDQLRRHGFNRYKHPLFGGVFCQQGPIAGMDSRRHRRLIGRQLVIIRQALPIGPEHPQNGSRRPDQPQKQQAGKHTDHGDEPPHKPFAARLSGAFYIGQFDQIAVIICRVIAAHRRGPYPTR